MFSIIIPYRDREQHLSTLLPRLVEVFEGKDYEIIVAEQGDSHKFRTAVVQNIGASFAKGDVFIFHDVDWYPANGVTYEFDGDPVYPYDKAIFLNQEGGLRPIWDIPSGYRHFQTDASNHVGGVIILSREQYETIGGWNPLYIGWGKEDNDREERIKDHGFNLTHRPGTFYTLYHEDNCPPTTDQDFIKNHEIFANRWQYYNIGANNIKCETVESAFTDLYPTYGKVRWITAKNIEIIGV